MSVDAMVLRRLFGRTDTEHSDRSTVAGVAEARPSVDRSATRSFYAGLTAEQKRLAVSDDAPLACGDSSLPRLIR